VAHLEPESSIILEHGKVVAGEAVAQPVLRPFFDAGSLARFINFDAEVGWRDRAFGFDVWLQPCLKGRQDGT
jgi:hypothetical protein